MPMLGTAQAAAALRNLAAIKGRQNPDQDALIATDAMASVMSQSQAAEKDALTTAAKAPQPEMKIHMTADGPQVEYKGPLQDPAQSIVEAKNDPFARYAESLKKMVQSSALVAERMPDPEEDLSSIDPEALARELGIQEPGFDPRTGIIGMITGKRRYNDLLSDRTKLQNAVMAQRLKNRMGALDPGKAALDEIQDVQDQDFKRRDFELRNRREDRLVQNQETALFFDLIRRNPLGYGSVEKGVAALEGVMQRPMSLAEKSVFENEFKIAEDEQQASQLQQQLAIERDDRARVGLQLQIEALRESQRNRQSSLQQGYAFKLQDDYRTDSKPFVDAETQLSKIETLANRKTGEADYAIIMNFVSSIDNSVARESEVATARGTVGLVEQGRQMLQKWKTGDLLAPEVRQRFVDTARALRQSLEPRKSQVQDYYRDRAESLGLDPRLVGPGLEKKSAQTSAPPKNKKLVTDIEEARRLLRGAN